MKRLLCLLFVVIPFVGNNQVFDTIYMNFNLGHSQNNFGYFTDLNEKRFLISKPSIPSEKIIKKLKQNGFIFFNPSQIYHTSFASNSLFHSRNLNIQFYRERIRIPFDRIDSLGIPVHNTTYYELLDSIILDTILYDGYIDSISQPFFIYNKSITNKNYRLFMDYVKDSIFKEVCYKNSVKAIKDKNVEVSIEKTLKILNLSNSEIKKLLKNKEQINFIQLRKRGLSKDKLEQYDRDYMPFLTELYLPDNERFYKRRFVDSQKLLYCFIDENGDSVSVPITYDSTNLINHFHWNSANNNLYYWHPMFLNYPINNISYFQAKAYCHFITEKLNNYLNLLNYDVKVDLPSYFHYEWVLRFETYPHWVFIDPILGFDLINNNGLWNPYDFNLSFNKIDYKNWKPDKREYLLTKSYAGKKYKSGVFMGNNNVSEITNDTLTNFYKTNIFKFWKYIEFINKKVPGMVESIEKLPEKGQLVLGSNWVYPIYQNYFGVNAKAVLQERYISREVQSSDLGFRMVLHLIPKQN